MLRPSSCAAVAAGGSLLSPAAAPAPAPRRSVIAPSAADASPAWKSLLCGGLAGSTAETLTLPLDTVKVRMQLQSDAARYRNPVHCARTMVAEEGVASLWKGLSPGLQRQVIFATLRIGLYEPVRNFYAGDLPEGATVPLTVKLAAGLTSGAIGITAANPTDLVKVRMQGSASGRYSSTLAAYRDIVAQSGLRGLYKGYLPNLVRNSVICAAELGSYDQAKQTLLASGAMTDGLPLHFACGLFAGFVATVVGSPVDVTKNRIMNAAEGEGGSALAVVRNIVAKEGLSAFYKGFFPNFARIAGWNICMFITYEQLKKLIM